VRRDLGAECECERSTERHSDQSVGAEQYPAAQRDQSDDPPEQKDRVHDVSDLVPAALGLVERREPAADCHWLRKHETNLRRWRSLR
jgi:hypothetical protein